MDLAILSRSHVRRARRIFSRRFLKRIRFEAVWRSEEIVLQWLWFIFNVDPERIGYGQGPLTWLRQSKHKKLRRKVHVCFLEYNPRGRKRKFGKLTAFWINERSLVCSASVNEGIEDADIVWVYSQDPITPGTRRQLLQSLARAKADTAIINHPDAYNSYHEGRVFKKLAEGGVRVPRTEFADENIGKTWVVYKAEGQHGASNLLSKYAGPRAGYRAFEFVASRNSDGLHTIYRAFYIAGIVSPTISMSSKHWNVHPRTMCRLEYAFDMTTLEARQVRLIAKTLGLEYFAVDYLRSERDGLPVFTDINIYPNVTFSVAPIEVKLVRFIANRLGLKDFPADYLRREHDDRLVLLDMRTYPKSYPAISLSESGRKLGYYGRWLTFDRFQPLGIAEQSGCPFWATFDEAMSSFFDRERTT
jgi:hypothetical protein